MQLCGQPIRQAQQQAHKQYKLAQSKGHELAAPDVHVAALVGSVVALAGSVARHLALPSPSSSTDLLASEDTAPHRRSRRPSPPDRHRAPPSSSGRRRPDTAPSSIAPDTPPRRIRPRRRPPPHGSPPSPLPCPSHSPVSASLSSSLPHHAVPAPVGALARPCGRAPRSRSSQPVAGRAQCPAVLTAPPHPHSASRPTSLTRSPSPGFCTRSMPGAPPRARPPWPPPPFCCPSPSAPHRSPGPRTPPAAAQPPVRPATRAPGASFHRPHLRASARSGHELAAPDVHVAALVGSVVALAGSVARHLALPSPSSSTDLLASEDTAPHRRSRRPSPPDRHRAPPSSSGRRRPDTAPSSIAPDTPPRRIRPRRRPPPHGSPPSPLPCPSHSPVSASLSSSLPHHAVPAPVGALARPCGRAPRSRSSQPVAGRAQCPAVLTAPPHPHSASRPTSLTRSPSPGFCTRSMPGAPPRARPPWPPPPFCCPSPSAPHRSPGPRTPPAAAQPPVRPATRAPGASFHRPPCGQAPVQVRLRPPRFASARTRYGP
nr:extensin-like [Aegilops tauschii subsp. strangulata]